MIFRLYIGVAILVHKELGPDYADTFERQDSGIVNVAMEEFTSLGVVQRPDERMLHYVLYDPTTGESRRQELEDHFEQVASFVLNDSVPDSIHVQFNIAKNVLVYTWFEYSLFPVAALQAFTTLEFALRERLGERVIAELKKQRKKGLYAYIEYSIEQGWINNEDFSAWHRTPMLRAKDEYLIKKINEMDEMGLDSMEVDFDEAEMPDTNTIDYLAILLRTANKIRNRHAHGEYILHPPSTWHTFEMCADFINAIYRVN
mgnify:CR=1 FL=1